MSWTEKAACRNRPDIDFFPTKVNPADSLKPEWRANTAAAKAVCGTCPVKAECLADVLAHPDAGGIWGGTTEEERRGMERVGRRARCGTDTGYYRHLRTDKTEPCEACKEAHAAYKRQKAKVETTAQREERLAKRRAAWAENREAILQRERERRRSLTPVMAQ